MKKTNFVDSQFYGIPVMILFILLCVNIFFGIVVTSIISSFILLNTIGAIYLNSLFIKNNSLIDRFHQCFVIVNVIVLNLEAFGWLLENKI